MYKWDLPIIDVENHVTVKFVANIKELIGMPGRVKKGLFSEKLITPPSSPLL